MAKRPFVGVMFRCCKVYGRAYLTADKQRFEARCPQCYQLVTLRVSSQGSNSRFFSVG
jgi:hypothetical protein